MIEDKYGNRKFYGVYRGVVYDNNDPIGQGRVKLQVPQIFADVPTSWAWGVNQPGVIRATPSVGEGVFVMFEGGDLSFPLWIGSFTEVTKGSFLDTLPNYGAFSDYTNQTIASTTAGYAMKFGTTDESNNIHIIDGTKIRFDVSGTYNLQWSGQFQNTGTNDEDSQVWLRKNGVDVNGSTGVINIPSKHGSVSGHTLAGWNFVFTVTAGDYYELWWQASSTAVTIQYYSGGTTPTTPSTASLILTVTQVK